MVSKGDDTVVLWPRYFDSRLSRAGGRRVPSDLAVLKPDAAWVMSAAKKAGLACELDEGAAHPGTPFEAAGRVLVTGTGKEAAIRAVAQQMATGKKE